MKQGRKQVPVAGEKPGQGDKPGVVPFTPRPKLLAVLSVLFAGWIAFLLMLYFTTVRHG